MDEILSLKGLDAFGHFSDAQLEEMAALLPVRQYSAGDSIYSTGELSYDAYLVLAGEVRLHSSRLTKPVDLWRAQSGEIFGETSFIARRRRVTASSASSDAEILVLSQKLLELMAESDPELERNLYWAFWQSVSRQLRLANARLAKIFETSSETSTAAPGSIREPRDDLSVDMTAKQELFEQQKLSEDEVHFLSSLAREEHFEADEIIFREGDTGETIYAILEGHVAIRRSVPGSGEGALAQLQPGDYFGEMALVDGSPRSADAMASGGGATVLALSREVIGSVLDAELSPSLRLLKLFCSVSTHHLHGIIDQITTWEALAQS